MTCHTAGISLPIDGAAVLTAGDYTAIIHADHTASIHHGASDTAGIYAAVHFAVVRIISCHAADAHHSLNCSGVFAV